jgi:hypothetical protein
MKNLLTLIRFAVVAGLALVAQPVLAYHDDNVEVLDEVVCESQKGRTTYCPLDTRGDVILTEQYSRTQCVEGHNWGADRRGIWVNQGCRGSFASVREIPRQRGRSNGYQANPQAIIRCESRGGDQSYCELPFRGRVRLVNQLSRSACVQGQSWGYDRRGVWVSQGCRGEFVVE